MNRAPLLAVVALALCSGASAKPLGEPLAKCFPIKEKSAAMARAAQLGKVQTFDADNSKKIIAAVNDLPPVTDWTASVVDTVTTESGVHVFFSDEKRMCMVEVAKPDFWNGLLDKTFGSGT